MFNNQQSWEKHATNLVNCADDAVVSTLKSIAADVGVQLDSTSPQALKVFIGRDTRPHSPRLSMLAIKGAESLFGIQATNIGVVTTPQLHHCVRSFNLPEEQHLATVEGYYTKVSNAYHSLLGASVSKASAPLLVDAAFGVGGPRFADLLRVVNAEVPQALNCAQIRNSPTGTGVPLSLEDEASRLNAGVGAEHVQKKLLLPEKTVGLPAEAGMRFASFDGDADRIVYFSADAYGALRLFDGDKIACLFVYYIQKQMAQLPESVTQGITLGCVQTAYANGAAQRYVKDQLKVEAPLAKTGVKYCHHKAVEYDIGVYFEANGHGTVLFKKHFIDKVRAFQNSGARSNASAEIRASEFAAAERILALEQLINQATGDAMADCLCVEAILKAENMTLEQWAALYTDLPSRQLKCKVADRSAITVTEDESRVITPKALQDAIDKAVAEYTQGRAFARPSGTEDAVRVYAEATNTEMADALALKVAQAIYDHAGGVGDRPN